jgi:hypothetical protein
MDRMDGVVAQTTAHFLVQPAHTGCACVRSAQSTSPLAGTLLVIQLYFHILALYKWHTSTGSKAVRRSVLLQLYSQRCPGGVHTADCCAHWLVGWLSVREALVESAMEGVVPRSLVGWLHTACTHTHTECSLSLDSLVEWLVAGCMDGWRGTSRYFVRS